ncbi:MAG: outer membrane protein [Fluviibacter sp.]|jgi:opacity protein-like surface antigen
MKKLIVAGAIATASCSALAAGTFDGPYVQLGIGGAATESSNSYTTSGLYKQVVGNIPNGSTNSGSFLGQVLGGYSQSFDRLNIAANIFYMIGNQDAGNKSYNTRYLNVPISLSNSVKLENTWGISLEPGYYVTDNTLGYLKFSWFNSTLKSTPSVSALGVTDTGNYSSNVNGAGFGIGAKQMFTNNLYGFLEYQYVTYGSTSLNTADGGVSISAKPSQNYGMLGLGYKF